MPETRIRIDKILYTTLRILLFSLLAFCIDQIFIFFTGGFSFIPPFIVIVVIYSGLILGEAWGSFSGFINGLIYAAVLLSNPGKTVLCWVITGYVAGRFRKYLFLERKRSTIAPLIFLLIVENVLHRVINMIF